MPRIMSSSYIFRRLALTPVPKAGNDLPMWAATDMPGVHRTDEMVGKMAPGFIEAVKADTRALPEGTAQLTMKEGIHTSDADPKEHYSAIAFDKDELKIGTLHFYVPEDGDRKKSEDRTGKGDA